VADTKCDVGQMDNKSKRWNIQNMARIHLIRHRVGAFKSYMPIYYN